MKRILYRHILLLLIVATGASCSRHGGGKLSLRQAHYVVAQADSLWREGQMYGVDAGDSATLAQAYETLGHFPLSIGNRRGEVYSRACYHYGRLLRAKENPVEAMQAFIAATHSRTRDYHIFGRVYSNMGSICHLAGEFQLSYDMYEKSAEMFHQNGDTLNYYYALNDMAYELAEQGSKNEAYYLVSLIEKKCFNLEVLTKTLETKAEACLYVNQYDSVLYYSDIICSNRNYASNIFLLRAKAFSFLGQKDSAVYYANYVLYMSDELFNKNSALYILTHDDDSKNMHEIRMTAADRSDVQKQIEIRQGKLSQAVQLLEQDLNRKPDLRWLYAIIVTVVIIGTGIILYVHRKRNQHHLLSQQIEDLTLQNITAQQQHEQILQEQIDYAKNIAVEIDNMCATITHAKEFPNNINWKDFASMCKILDDNFYMFISKLNRISTLNETEIRLCVLVFLNMDRAEISDILPYAKNGVGKLKYRVAQKLGIDSKDMRKYLISVIVNRPSAT